jgi:hypothetical protein
MAWIRFAQAIPSSKKMGARKWRHKLVFDLPIVTALKRRSLKKAWTLCFLNIK